MQGKFRVGLTSDVGDKETFKADYYGIEVLDDHEGIEWEMMEGDSDPLTPDDVRDYDALLVFGSRVSADTFAGADRPVTGGEVRRRVRHGRRRGLHRERCGPDNHAGRRSAAHGLFVRGLHPRARPQAHVEGPDHSQRAMGHAVHPDRASGCGTASWGWSAWETSAVTCWS